jgi:hypothetical protein
LKASFEAINLGVQTHEFRIGQEIAGAAQVQNIYSIIMMFW